jgi:oxygen-independent coproporphyrinogen-3 oxidase
VAPRAPLDGLTGISAARFGLYVHFPYCLSKCPYCDFASTAAKVVPQERYTRALLTELQRRAQGLSGRQLDSIYFGGGTPSLWDPRYVEQVLDEAARLFQIAFGAEVTLEANPGAADATRFAGYAKAGINRLSIGVQSFQARTLKALGREHDGAQAAAAFKAARAAGFGNISMDFIYGVHGQTLEEATLDATMAAAMGAEHLSAYALTLDAQSLAEEVPLAKQYARGELELPADDTVVAMQRAVSEAYERAGLHRYEISNYAREGFHSRHNCLYWTGGEYLSIGTGATGFLLQGAQAGERYSNHRSAEKYLAAVEAGASPNGATEPLGVEALFTERLAMGLRLRSGVDVAKVFAAYEREVEPRGQLLHALVSNQLAVEHQGRLQLTPQGFDLHSAIAARLV